MATPLASVHLFTAATVGAIDGIQVAETLNENTKIILSGLRGLYSNVQNLGIRSDSLSCFFVKLTSMGNNASKIFLSTNGSTWRNSITLFEVKDVNTIFYIKTLFDENEDYGNDITNWLQIDFLARV